jgi:hypothetical protein
VSTQRRQRQLASTWTARRRREKQFQARPGVIFRPAKQIAQFYYAYSTYLGVGGGAFLSR